MADGRFDVVIVGAGIAGSALAAALSGRGLAIALVEGQPLDRPGLPDAVAVDAFDPRVSALTPRSRALLEEIGAWEEIAAYRLCPYGRMSVWDAQGTGRIDFDCAELDAPALGYIVENRAVINALLGRLEGATDVTPFSPDKLESFQATDDGVEVQLASGQALGCSLLVGADGAMSRVRELGDFATREWDYGHRAIVTTVQVERDHEATAWQRFLPTGPLAFLPLPGTEDAHFCSIVWSIDEDKADAILALDDAGFCAALAEAFESRLGNVVATARRFAFPLRQRHAVDYVAPGIALVADAAHTIHPLAGQGINLGLQDVAALSEELRGLSGAALGELSALRRYQRRRKGENLLMMSAMDGFKRLFEQDALPLRWLRNEGMRLVGSVTPVKQQLMRHAMGLG